MSQAVNRWCVEAMLACHGNTCWQASHLMNVQACFLSREGGPEDAKYTKLFDGLIGGRHNKRVQPRNRWGAVVVQRDYTYCKFPVELRHARTVHATKDGRQL
jgi:hypothetical protein